MKREHVYLTNYPCPWRIDAVAVKICKNIAIPLKATKQSSSSWK
jgi:hypothetical protein